MGLEIEEPAGVRANSRKDDAPGRYPPRGIQNGGTTI